MKWQRWMGLVVALGLVVVWTTWSQAAAEDTGGITGKVFFKGEPERRTVLNKLFPADPNCVEFNKDKKVGSETFIFNKKSGTLRNVVVFVKEGLGETTFEAPAAPATIEQKGCMYKPHILTMQTGQPLVVKNSDATMHNINGKPKKNAPFNFAQPKAGMTRELSIKRAEIFKVKCDVHSWMNAYVAVFDHPFHSITGKDGVFTISGLPPGEYVIAAWHEKYGEVVTQKVTVKAGEATEADLTIEDKK